MTTEQTEIEQVTETKQEAKEESTGIFQAVGIITGDVSFIFVEERNKYIANITIGQYQYNLYPNGSSWSKSASFNRLRKEIESTGGSEAGF